MAKGDVHRLEVERVRTWGAKTVLDAHSVVVISRPRTSEVGLALKAEDGTIFAICEWPLDVAERVAIEIGEEVARIRRKGLQVI